MTADGFEKRLDALRPRLHRYCSRMAGSTVDGEDLVQETLLKAVRARAAGIGVDNLEGWLFRIAHNASLDLLRHRKQCPLVALEKGLDVASPPNGDVVAISFQTFLQLPELQRCAIILKDVLGHSIEEIARIAGCTQPAAKSALQRGRATLRRLASLPPDVRLPLMTAATRRRTAAFADLFRTGDFDAIRAMLAEDVELDLVNRLHLRGRERIAPYFERYAEETKWRFGFGAVEGRPAMLVFDRVDMARPAHFVLVDWHGDRIVKIRDFLFAPYAMEAVDWVRLERHAGSE